MLLNMLKSKIHRAVVTEANADYVGSITIDVDLMEKAQLMEYEQVHVVDIDNGNRLVTYVIEGQRGSGVICLNGAAAKLVKVGDKVIIMAYCQVSKEQVGEHEPRIVLVDEKNRQMKIFNKEIHGEIDG